MDNLINFFYFIVLQIEWSDLPPWLSAIGHLTTGAFAGFAFFLAKNTFNIAGENLESVKDSQKHQIHMNLVSLENEIKSRRLFFIEAFANQKSFQSDVQKLDTETLEKSNWVTEARILEEKAHEALQYYCMVCNQLAFLISESKDSEHFKNRDWKGLYNSHFEDASKSVIGFPTLEEHGLGPTKALLREWS